MSNNKKKAAQKLPVIDPYLPHNGNFGYRDNQLANTNFVGDFDVQWLLTPSGDIRLKGYNQTNDRYFTKNSLNTQGFGLIMKKDFNGLKDLFGIKKKKKKNKNKGKTIGK